VFAISSYYVRQSSATPSILDKIGRVVCHESIGAHMQVSMVENQEAVLLLNQEGGEKPNMRCNFHQNISDY
jgi:hypothetical protein